MLLIMEWMQEFIKRAQVIAKPEVEKNSEHRRILNSKWGKDNPDKLKVSQRKYNKTHKGRISGRRRYAISNTRIRHFKDTLTQQEIEEIVNFYLNRPPGMEVDHIIPISRGGLHHISNLQYLTKIDNMKKGNKLPYELILRMEESKNPRKKLTIEELKWKKTYEILAKWRSENFESKICS